MVTSILLLILSLVSLCVGRVFLSPGQVLSMVLGGMTDSTPSQLLWQFRIPKLITAILAGGGLGVSGLQLQTLFRNPLAEPFVLGISGGASLGVAIVVLAEGILPFPLPDLSFVGGACLGATAVLLLLLLVSARLTDSRSLLILGLLLSYIFSALASLLVYFAPTDRIQQFLSWSTGSFRGVSLAELGYFSVLITVSLGIAFGLISALNILLLGEEYAVSLGVSLPKVRLLLVLSSSLMSGTVTAYCGPISFLGIIVPHICRLAWSTSDHSWLCPTTVVVGALLAIAADLLTQLPPVMLPLNTVTTLLGAPVVLLILRHNKL
ncbi:MAG: iron ABC transporter permease [Pseudanabaenaceae cyanobacterium SKYG29]|nr:iron ABC transporter permease [Pseudanabaenaceae cyanobacterium SKYG29]